MSLDNSRLLKSRALLLSLAEPLQKSQVLALESTTEATALAGWEQFNQLLIAHIKELVEVHTAVGELPEDTLLARLDLGLNIRVSNVRLRKWVRAGELKLGDKKGRDNSGRE